MAASEPPSRRNRSLPPHVPNASVESDRRERDGGERDGGERDGGGPAKRPVALDSSAAKVARSSRRFDFSALLQSATAERAEPTPEEQAAVAITQRLDISQVKRPPALTHHQEPIEERPVCREASPLFDALPATAPEFGVVLTPADAWPPTRRDLTGAVWEPVNAERNRPFSTQAGPVYSQHVSTSAGSIYSQPIGPPIGSIPPRGLGKPAARARRDAFYFEMPRSLGSVKALVGFAVGTARSLLLLAWLLIFGFSAGASVDALIVRLTSYRITQDLVPSLTTALTPTAPHATATQAHKTALAPASGARRHGPGSGQRVRQAAIRSANRPFGIHTARATDTSSRRIVECVAMVVTVSLLCLLVVTSQALMARRSGDNGSLWAALSAMLCGVVLFGGISLGIILVESGFSIAGR